MMSALRAVCSAFLLWCFGLAPSTTSEAWHQRDTGPISEWLDRYDRGDRAAVATELTRIADLKSFEIQLGQIAPHWIAADTSSTDRRRLIAASVALETARGVIEHAAPEPREIATRLIGWADQQLRLTARPLSAERWWRLSAIALSERLADAYLLTGFLPKTLDPRIAARIRQRNGPGVNQLGRALERFPDEERLKLAVVYCAEVHETGHLLFQLSYDPARGTDPVVARERPTWQRLVDRYDEISGLASVRGDALVRGGVIEFRLGRDEAALAKLTSVDAATDDAALRYLSRFFQGKVLEHLVRPGDAESKYRSALEIEPRAGSASISLGTLLFLGSDRGEASRMIQDTLSGIAPDPWREYAWGDWRLWPALIARLREELR